jgi:hypothetical protein
LTPPLLALVVLVLLAIPALALAAAPWNGDPISAGLGPTYGETWVVPATGEAVSGMQGVSGQPVDTLALIPYAAIKGTLDKFQEEAMAAGVPLRMSYSVMGQSEGGRDMYEVVINATETDAQVRDFERWQQVRALTLIDPVAAQALLASFGGEVKMVIYIDASIHGNEYEGVDAAMQIIRDLMVTPRGANATVDDILDNAIVVVSPCANPDGRVLGTRANAAGIDMNRDYFVQSQPEVRNTVALLRRWLPPVMLAFHGYYTPTLIDGLTFPHNPGYEYDLFGAWNQKRTQANRADFTAAERSLQIPVNDYGAQYTRTIAAAPTGATQSGNTVTITTAADHGLSGGETVTITGALDVRYRGTFTVTSVPTSTSFTYTNPMPSPVPASGGGTVSVNPGPAVSDGWDDWGPFYGQSYPAFLGVDGSTVEMSNNVTLGGRFNAKRDQYLAFYSSARFWVLNRQGIMNDQIEIFRRGMSDADWDASAFANTPLLADLGFTDAIHNWMYPFPKAYVIPFGAGQRSDAEANRLVEWLLENGILVTRMTADFTWGGTTYRAGSYVVGMQQPMRGLAREALSAGIDISPRTSRLYASPAAWSLGLTWGANVAEVPRGDATFAPSVTPIAAPNELNGGVRGGLGAPSAWYSVTPKGVREFRAVMALLRDGIRGGIAEEAFTSTTGGRMPAGTLLFPADGATAAKLDAAGKTAGLWFERNVGVAKPATTRVAEAPKVAVLRATYTPPATTASYNAMVRTFGAASVGYVTTGGTGDISLAAAAVDPLLGYDFIWNEGAGWPTNTTAQTRLNAFFARGGGYFGDNAATANYTLLTASGLVAGSITQGSTLGANTYGGIHRWVNVAGENSPVTGAYPSEDFGFIPSRIWWFTAIPTGAVVDARYASNMTTGGGWVSGMWVNRTLTPGVDSGMLVARGTTAANSRYVVHSSDLTSRLYPERAWLMVGQAANWSNLTDETIPVAYTISATAGAGGTITPSGDRWVAVGGSQTYTIKPDLGFMVADVLVNGASVGRVTSYAFTDVDADATISASFVPFVSAGVRSPLSPTKVTVVGGSSVPVRFQIYDTAGLSMSLLKPRLYLALWEDGVWGPEFPAASTSSPKRSSNVFRYDERTAQYTYNLNLKLLGPGVYLLRIDLGYGGEIFAQIQVK